MTVRRAPLLLVLGLLALAGCRDALVDEAPLTPPDPEEESGMRSAYLKGPEAMTLGETREFRAEPIQEATRYAWEIRDASTGRLSGRLETDAEGRDRRLIAEATRTGYVLLQVSVFSDDALIRVGTKTILVRP